MYKLSASGKVKGVYFSLGTTPSDDPQLDCVSAICNLFKTAKRSAHVCIYSLTEPNIVDAMIQAHKRGIEVIVVCDLTQNKGKAMKTALMRLDEAGVLVRIAKKQKACMHNKVVIFDNNIVCTGSFNFSRNARYRNDENLVVLQGKEIADAFEKYVFDRVFDYETLSRV